MPKVMNARKTFIEYLQRIITSVRPSVNSFSSNPKTFE
ncbi:MAG: hypothetical protein AVDCRST_MAG96-1587 [uncultured Segetibacter sp.]|uniref:Uncharacterized protein n=1 Tax=uncultured Segetibacter sp. TaxID=481133 RepID=A0A6J4SFJ4_9BACT|nr:MAG: hypothetical protein AVDCRST_MAG96-1587 [uncultured Segetibacter sp.]